MVKNRISPTTEATAAKESAGMERMRRGSPKPLTGDAWQKLVVANMPLVIHVAERYSYRGLQFDDAVGEGVLGLIRAAESYDPNRGAQFGTYAYLWIAQAIRRASLNANRVIRLPGQAIGLAMRLQRHRNKIAKEGRPEPSDAQAAHGLKLSPRRFRTAQMAVRVISGCDPTHEPNAEGSMRSLADASARDLRAPVDVMIAEEQRRLLRRAVHRLDERSRTILTQRFGLGEAAPMTFDEIAAMHGMSHEGVRQVVKRSLDRLRSMLQADSSRDS